MSNSVDELSLMAVLPRFPWSSRSAGEIAPHHTTNSSNSGGGVTRIRMQSAPSASTMSRGGLAAGTGPPGALHPRVDHNSASDCLLDDSSSAASAFSETAVADSMYIRAATSFQPSPSLSKKVSSVSHLYQSEHPNTSAATSPSGGPGAGPSNGATSIAAVSPGRAPAVEDILDWEVRSEDTPFWIHAVAGSSAGVLEHVSMFPLDTVKTRLQSGAGGFRHLGFRGYFRGVSAIAAGCIPAHAVLFSVFEASKSILSTDHAVQSAICGAAATAGHDLILTPSDVVKQRLQLGKYNGVAHCVRTILRTEGPQAFFRSLPITLFMNMPYGAVMVACNEKLKSLMHLDVTQTDGAVNLPKYFIAAGIAGGVAAAATNPFDVVKTHLQTTDFVKEQVGPFKAMHVATRALLQEEGVRALWRGASARVLLAMPGAAVCWGSYAAVKNALFQRFHE